jgi:hypothetical protein
VGIRWWTAGRACEGRRRVCGGYSATNRRSPKHTSATELAEKTIAYADAKISYYKAFRAAMPEVTNIAMGREPRPQEVDKFRDAFPGSGGEILEIAADKETAVLLERFSGNLEIQKAAAEFDHAQKLEQTFLKDFEGQDFTSRSLEDERANSSNWRAVVLNPQSYRFEEPCFACPPF